MDRSKIPGRLRECRGNRTQQEVADAIGVHKQTISDYERGWRFPNDANKVKLAKFYNKDIVELFFAD